MGHISYLKDMSESIEEDNKNYYLSEKAFFEISDYTRSQPTAPSIGRVYRKNLKWSDPENPNWFLYICTGAQGDEEINSPKGKPYTYHRGKKVIFV